MASLTAAGELAFSLSPGMPAKDESPIFLTETMVNHLPLTIRGTSQTSTTCNWFRGADRSTWRSHVPTFGAVDLGEVYPAVTASIVAAGPTVEKVFVVQPGGKPQAIRLRISGADSINVSSTGELCAYSPAGKVQFSKPVAYQDVDGHRNYVEVGYAMTGSTYGFWLGDYDSSSPLTIDPMFSFTYYGGSSGEQIPNRPAPDGIIDHQGNIIMVGSTQSVDLPVPGGSDNTLDGPYDVFIAKFSPDLGQLLAATYLGGSASEVANEVAVDDEDNIYVLGNTESADFPTTSNAFDRTHAGGQDAFVAKFSPDLSQLSASTYLGGSRGDFAQYVIVNGTGDVYIGIFTESNDLPTFPDAFDSDGTIGGIYDLYLAKFSGDLETLQTATYFGGSDRECLLNLAFGLTGNIYFMGSTESNDFPITAGAYDQTCPGGFVAMDGFVSCLGPDLDTLIASTYIGGSAAEFPYGLAIDANGDVYITGHVGETWPTTPGAYDRTYGGGPEIYDDVGVARLSGDLTTLIASTYIGGSEWDHGSTIMIDGAGGVYVAGTTGSLDFPTTPDADDPTFNGVLDIFVVKLDVNLTTLQSSTYYGGPGTELGDLAAVVAPGEVYITGLSEGLDFPPPLGGYDMSYNGGTDVFVAKLCLDTDCDGDGVLNVDDNCVITPNADQSDADGDGFGDLCDVCPADFNPAQEDINGNGVGDLCEIPETWYVQADGLGEAPTIQAAIDSTTHDDTVLVADGVYTGPGNWTLDFRGRRILLRSENGPRQTIIDCQGSSTTPRRAFTFDSNEDSTFVVDGFTFTNGYGEYFSGGFSGGAMLINNCSPVIQNCIFIGNRAVFGGAVYSYHTSAHLANCTFAGNSAPYGAAVFGYTQATAELENCVVAFNSGGQPVYCLESSTATLACCDVYGNAGGDYVGAIAGQNGINGNFSADPLFCDRENGDWGLSSNSPCLPANNGCAVLVGALDSGCVCNCGLWGDLTGDEAINPLDVIYMVNFIYRQLDARVQPPYCPYEAGDIDCDDQINPVDVVHYINYVYKNITPWPCEPCPPDDSLLEIPLGTSPLIDGIINAGEWSDAATREFAIDGHVAITVMIKHDGTNLLAAYYYLFEQEENLCFPELLIDAGNDKTEDWLNDDWWFHVSATDCEAHGTYDVWNDCSVVQPDWQGVPNFKSSQPLDTFEVAIRLVKIGVAPGDTIGLAFRAEYVPYIYGYWPTAAMAESPATWAVAILKQ